MKYLNLYETKTVNSFCNPMTLIKSFDRSNVREVSTAIKMVFNQEPENFKWYHQFSNARDSYMMLWNKCIYPLDIPSPQMIRFDSSNLWKLRTSNGWYRVQYHNKKICVTCNRLVQVTDTQNDTTKKWKGSILNGRKIKLVSFQVWNFEPYIHNSYQESK